MPSKVKVLSIHHLCVLNQQTKDALPNSPKCPLRYFIRRPSFSLYEGNIVIQTRPAASSCCPYMHSHYCVKGERLRMEEQVELVGKAFVEHYYNVFDADRSVLSSLYQGGSMLTFEGEQIQGVEEICNKLVQLPFDHCQHLISTVDSQPSSPTGGIIVFVSGSMRLAGEEHPLRFSQMFHLMPTIDGSFFVQNDIFRLNYG